MIYFGYNRTDNRKKRLFHFICIFFKNKILFLIGIIISRKKWQKLGSKRSAGKSDWQAKKNEEC